MDCPLPLPTLASNDRRVSSPSAANTDARVLSAAAPLRSLLDMTCDILHLLPPAALVHAERLVATMGRQLVEARFDHPHPRSARGLLQRELDQRGRLRGIVLLRIDR